MKVLRRTKDGLVLHLGKREKQLLFGLLRLYPCVPPAHQPISKTGSLPELEASQALLDEALAEQRAENKKQLQAFLSDPNCFAEDASGWRMTLSPAVLEWLLQIVNDIRVGSWINLGSPEEKLEVLTPKTAPHVWAMQMAGYIQMELLEALRPAP